MNTVDSPLYDRQLLLGPKRDSVLELWEVQRYGRDSYGDPDYVSIYGLRPADWCAKGIRLLGRTAVECTRDDLAVAIGRDVAMIAETAPTVGSMVVDPFAGSGNTLYWMLRHLPGAQGLGLEVDGTVFQLTSQNLLRLKLPVKVLHSDYAAGLDRMRVPPGCLLVAFIAPPWGNALSPIGLDLRRTTPPIAEVVELLARKFCRTPLLCAIQIYERIDPDSLTDTRRHFEWSALRIYDFNAPGQNHGILLGTNGWTPS